VTSIPLAQPQVFHSDANDTTWHDAVLSTPDFLAFCRREGLPGEDPGPVSFISVPPTEWGCHESSSLSWVEGAPTASVASWACKRLSCRYCACWKNVERLSQTAERQGVPFSPEYVAQIYNGVSCRCRSAPHIQLYATWLRPGVLPHKMKRRLRGQVDRLRKRGQTVEYFAIADQGWGWWVLSTVPMWDETVGRRGRRPKASAVAVTVPAEVGLAWLFGIFSSAKAIDWTRSEGWEPPKVAKGAGRGKIELGTGKGDEIERVRKLLRTSLKGMCEPEARAAVSRAFRDDRALIHGTGSCTTCGGSVGLRDRYRWDPACGFTCSSCVGEENAQKMAHVLAPTLQPLLADGPVNEGAIERCLSAKWAWRKYSFWKDRDMLELALTLAGGVCHPDTGWSSIGSQSSAAATQ
jgi:hypothetical protein